MISAKSIQRLYQPPKLHKLRAVKKLHSLRVGSDVSNNDTEERQLSREQVLEIYDWIAQLNAQ